MTVSLRSMTVAGTVQMAQEVSKAHGTVLDGGASQPAAALLQIRVHVANAQARKALLVGARSKRRQEPQRQRPRAGPRLQVQPTQITKPGVIVLQDGTVEGFERVARWIDDGPCSVGESRQYSKGAGEGQRHFSKGGGSPRR